MSIPNQNAATFALPPPRHSSWSFVTSDGADLNISIPETQIGGVISGGRLFVKNSSSPTIETLSFAGLGASVGYQPIPVPGNFDFSIQQFPCSGVIYTGPLAGSQLVRNDFRGPCLFYQISAQVGVGYGGMLMFLGASCATIMIPSLPLRLAALVASCRAIVAFRGMSVSVIPGSVGAFGAFGICL